MTNCSKRLVAICMVITCVVSGITIGACSEPSLIRMDETRTMMGTFISISLYASDEVAGGKALDAAFRRFEEVEATASMFDERAEAYRLNQHGSVSNPSRDLKELIELAIEYGRITDGYFDITVQPLLELWQDGLWRESPEAQQEAVDKAMNLVGYEKVLVEDGRIELAIDGMKITLGGIAKGWAAEEAIKVLEEKGIQHALVNAGGDMATMGVKPDGSPWRIELVSPDDKSNKLSVFEVAGHAVATSGNYERYFDPDKSVSHILNPLTGYSVSECISVTIISCDATFADVAATAVFVMGPEEGMRFINEKSGIEGLIIDNERNIHRSSGLNEFEVSS